MPQCTLTTVVTSLLTVGWVLTARIYSYVCKNKFNHVRCVSAFVIIKFAICPFQLKMQINLSYLRLK